MKKECPSCTKWIPSDARSCHLCGIRIPPEPARNWNWKLVGGLIFAVLALFWLLGSGSDQQTETTPAPEQPPLSAAPLPEKSPAPPTPPAPPPVAARPLPEPEKLPEESFLSLKKEAIKHGLQPCFNHFAGKAPGFQWTAGEWEMFMQREPTIRLSLAGLIATAEQVSTFRRTEDPVPDLPGELQSRRHLTKKNPALFTAGPGGEQLGKLIVEHGLGRE